MKSQNIKIISPIFAILTLALSVGCIQIRNMPEASAVASAPSPDFAQAEAFEANGDFQRAAVAYLEITEKDPRSAVAFQRMAICLDKQGLTTQSKPYYLQALKLCPNHADLHCDYGYSSYLQGDLVQAERSYQTALRLNANLPRAHNNLAQLLAQSERVSEALEHSKKAGCNEEQIRQNIEFAAAGNRRSIPSPAKPEPQAMLADLPPPDPGETQSAQSVLKLTSQAQDTNIDDEIAPPKEVVVANTIPLPEVNVDFASFQKPATADDPPGVELSTQTSSRRLQRSPQSSRLPFQRVNVSLSD